ncbi:MAG: HigA family addiction module antitoxin [Opitutaceae bacterium]|jgi:addiction module HigA family antidote
MKTKSQIKPWHPGELIKEDFLADYGLTQYALAKELKIPQSRLTEIIKGRRGITADTALRLARYFGNSPEFWLNLQADYDLRTADRKKIENEVHPRAA